MEGDSCREMKRLDCEGENTDCAADLNNARRRRRSQRAKQHKLIASYSDCAQSFPYVFGVQQNSDATSRVAKASG